MKDLKDLADILTSIEVFLNTSPRKIKEVRERFITLEQLAEARKIVFANPEIMKHYENFDKERDSCRECMKYKICSELVDVDNNPYPCRIRPMFTPEKIFRNVKGFEHLKPDYKPR